MTSETGNQIQFRAHHQLAREFYRDQNILSHVQFNAVDWTSVHSTLHDLPQLFQVWAAKHVLGIAGTMKFQAHQDGRSPMCPSCNYCMELCSHVTRCLEEGRTLVFKQSAQMMELWLKKNYTHPDLQSLLLRYLSGRGSVTCSECSKELNLPHIIQEFFASQDVIGRVHHGDGLLKPPPFPKRIPSPMQFLLSGSTLDVRGDHPSSSGDSLLVDLLMHSSP